jgi:hypothetical protein
MHLSLPLLLHTDAVLPSPACMSAEARLLSHGRAVFCSLSPSLLPRPLLDERSAVPHNRRKGGRHSWVHELKHHTRQPARIFILRPSRHSFSFTLLSATLYP